jgi:hypothetical protein
MVGGDDGRRIALSVPRPMPAGWAPAGKPISVRVPSLSAMLDFQSRDRIRSDGDREAVDGREDGPSEGIDEADESASPPETVGVAVLRVGTFDGVNDAGTQVAPAVEAAGHELVVEEPMAADFDPSRSPCRR